MPFPGGTSGLIKHVFCFLDPSSQFCNTFKYSHFTNFALLWPVNESICDAKIDCILTVLTYIIDIVEHISRNPDLDCKICNS